MKKKTKAKMIIVCTLLLTLFLTGCGLFKSDTQKLKELLEAKYGEEFGVESYYYAGDMWAMCYPVSDPTLIFQVRTDEQVTHIVHDYYLQNVVARQLEEKYEPLAQQAFPGCYLSVDVWAVDYAGQTADNVTLASMLQYENSSSEDEDVKWTHIIINIFVDISQMTEENIEAEYAFLRDEIGGCVANGELPDTYVDLYYGDTEFVQACELILAEETWRGSSEIYDMIEECPKNWMGYLGNGDAVFTLDEYIEMRMEALKSE